MLTSNSCLLCSLWHIHYYELKDTELPNHDDDDDDDMMMMMMMTACMYILSK